MLDIETLREMARNPVRRRMVIEALNETERQIEREEIRYSDANRDHAFVEKMKAHRDKLLEVLK